MFIIVVLFARKTVRLCLCQQFEPFGLSMFIIAKLIPIKTVLSTECSIRSQSVHHCWFVCCEVSPCQQSEPVDLVYLCKFAYCKDFLFKRMNQLVSELSLQTFFYNNSSCQQNALFGLSMFFIVSLFAVKKVLFNSVVLLCLSIFIIANLHAIQAFLVSRINLLVSEWSLL